MAEDDDTTCKISPCSSACSVEASPSEVDAGADMTLKGKVSCSPAGDLRGKTLLVMDQDGALAESIELSEFDGETNETSEFVVKAPVRPGAYTWLAVCPACETAGISLEEASAPFSFTVKPHSTRVVVWDAPSTIECGEKFSVKLGIKCSSECRLFSASLLLGLIPMTAGLAGFLILIWGGFLEFISPALPGTEHAMNPTAGWSPASRRVPRNRGLVDAGGAGPLTTVPVVEKDAGAAG